MPFTVKKTISLSIVGDTGTYKRQDETLVDNRLSANPEVPAAKSGTLTTRTDNSTGTLTMASGHGIATGNKLDIFWTTTTGTGSTLKTFNWSRLNMTVGTVSGNSVPVSGGTGDNLPVAASELTAMVPAKEDFSAVGNNVTHIVLSAPVNSGITFFAADGTTVVATFQMKKDAGTPSNWTYFWDSNYGTSPIAGATLGKVGFSQSKVDAVATLYAAVFYN
jgi:hypothetical protein